MALKLTYLFCSKHYISADIRFVIDLDFNYYYYCYTKTIFFVSFFVKFDFLQFFVLKILVLKSVLKYINHFPDVLNSEFISEFSGIRLFYEKKKISNTFSTIPETFSENTFFLFLDLFYNFFGNKINF